MFQGYVQQRQHIHGMGQRPVAMVTATNNVYQQQMPQTDYLQQTLQQQTQPFIPGQPQVLNYIAGPGGQVQMQVRVVSCCSAIVNKGGRQWRYPTSAVFVKFGLMDDFKTRVCSYGAKLM